MTSQLPLFAAYSWSEPTRSPSFNPDFDNAVDCTYDVGSLAPNWTPTITFGKWHGDDQWWHVETDNNTHITGVGDDASWEGSGRLTFFARSGDIYFESDLPISSDQVAGLGAIANEVFRQSSATITQLGAIQTFESKCPDLVSSDNDIRESVKGMSSAYRAKVLAGASSSDCYALTTALLG